MRNYATFSNEVLYNLHNAFLDSSDTAKNLMTDEYFNFCVPHVIELLRKLQMIINTRNELILIRARNDNNYMVGNPATESN